VATPGGGQAGRRAGGQFIPGSFGHMEICGDGGSARPPGRLPAPKKKPGSRGTGLRRSG
jgi:hypothetical protein